MAPDREVLAQFSVQLLHSFKYRFELNKLLANNTADKLLANNTADKQLENVKNIHKSSRPRFQRLNNSTLLDQNMKHRLLASYSYRFSSVLLYVHRNHEDC